MTSLAECRGWILEAAVPAVARRVAAGGFPTHLMEPLREWACVAYLSAPDLVAAIGTLEVEAAVREALRVLDGRECAWQIVAGDAMTARALRALGTRAVDGCGRA